MSLGVLFFYILFFFLCGLVGFVISRKHLIMVLVSLEFMVLGLYLIIVFWFSLFDFGYYYCVVFLVMSVCGGVIGLTVLICMVRSHGSDLFLVGSLLSC